MIVGAMTMILGTAIVYQRMPSSDDRCDLNCVVSIGEYDQSSNTDSDTDGHDCHW